MRRAQDTSHRRMGPIGSPQWSALLDAAEAILREDGYGALTSRSVAERAGVKQRLVYYYFQTMDDLTVETFLRLSARELDRLRDACASTRPLRGLWEVSTHTEDARIVSEFMALANRIERLRAEVIAFIEEARRLQVQSVTAALERHGSKIRLPPAALALMATSVALAINREAQLGIAAGHREVSQVITDLLDHFEPREEAGANSAG